RENDLYDIAYSDVRDELKAHAFLRASLPVVLAGDLRAIAEQVHTPLAIRSSSLLEDAMFEPFASVYATKMVPNNLPDTDSRFVQLAEAVKFIYASTFFKSARDYMRVASHSVEDEKMAVIIQDIIGTRFGDRYYPHISGVMRSFNFYPFGRAEPEEGVVELALGLGRTIVDDGVSWAFSPAWPSVRPPFRSTGDMLKHTQTSFWAVNMGRLYTYDPAAETEYLGLFDLKDCEYDGSIALLASTYDHQDDRLESGIFRDGPRVIDFSPVLESRDFPLNESLVMIMKECEDRLGAMVEVEFAMRLGESLGDPAELGFLQTRPMVVSKSEVTVDEEELEDPSALLSSTTVLGNGINDSISDVVYLDPETFNIRDSRVIASEVDRINRRLLDEGRSYVLIGFGRWGTTDPLGGIPVDFGQISGAKVIVETSLPGLEFMMSQGSHFFHNVTSFRVFYFSMRHGDRHSIDWEWLRSRKAGLEMEHVRHIELDSPLIVRVDGRSGRGVILHD
ncbi:MAG TPA: PEP/pyruvate-binding domain-containing protein, partial [Candidatus Krumholzibacterium sp.]|nr:PEP/pyruvate-binding domain-containing protein [Candidatus Krumholzibacterium sp.]